MMMKRLAFLFATVCLALAAAAACAAEKPAYGMKPRTVLTGEGTMTGKGTAQSTVSGASQCSTGKTYTWTLRDNTASATTNYYELMIAVMDGTYESANIADIQYSPKRSKSREISYTFYIPGVYYLFAEIYRSESSGSPIETRSMKITVADGGENALTRKVREVAADNQKESEYETVLALHDWVIDHCEYDETYTWYSADSLLLNGTGVCNSYTRALTLLLEEAGIKCRRVSGYVWGDSSAGHAWSAVQISGKWYLLDATWDDMEGEFSRHAYFAVTSELMDIEHTAEHFAGSGARPVCSSLDENWFIHGEKWRGYSGSMLAEYAVKMNGGWHRFRLAAPVYKSDKYEKILLGTVAAYGMTKAVWTYGEGKECAGDFRYDRENGLITGRHRMTGILELPRNLARVEAGSFANTDANMVVIPENCEYIGPGAFAGMDLWELSVSAKNTVIDENAFGDIPFVYVIAPGDSTAAAFARERGWAVGDGTD